MPISELTNGQAVLQAMAEYDWLGRDAFLQQHGQGQARRFFVVRPDGYRYDSKARAGVAYGYQFPDRGPLKASQFSGGEATVMTRFRQHSRQQA